MQQKYFASENEHILNITTTIKLVESKYPDGKMGYQLGAFINNVKFDYFDVDSPNSEKMAELAKKIALKWLSISAQAEGADDKDILSSIEFKAALPPHLSPNIAICYRNKFHQMEDLSRDFDQNRLNEARKLEGQILVFKFKSSDLQFLIPSDTSKPNIVKDNLIIRNNEGKIIPTKFVPLTSFNKDSNLLSIELCGEACEKVLEIATNVTGNAETASPTNIEKNKVPFSLTLAKMSNLIPVLEQALSSNKIPEYS